MPKTKTVLLGTTKILQWNAGGLSPQKFTELKLILNKKKVNAFIINGCRFIYHSELVYWYCPCSTMNVWTSSDTST
jgi:hypothetical protein